MPLNVEKSWGKDPQEVISRIKEWLQAVLHGVVYLCAETARRMEGYAKANRRWTDRSNQARGGLKGRVRVLETGHAQAIIAHTVEYGIWLEVRRSFHGRYAILVRTKEAHEDEFWSAFTTMVFDFT